MQVLLARPRGFCAGVTSVIAIVERAFEVFGERFYVRHDIVHNRTVVQKLRDQGAVFVDEVSEVPDGATLIFSAHGVSKAVQCEAQGRNLRIFDATCPLVTKVHREVMRMREAGKTIIMIGHAGHPEVEGTMGQVEDGMLLVESPEAAAALPADLNSTPLAYVSQTTLSVDDARSVIDVLKRRFPSIVEPKKSDVCYATQNRQDAVKKLAREVDLILVIGSVSSSNSNRLREVGEREGAKAHLVDSAQHLDNAWFEGVERVGITAGASAPEFLVQGVLDYLRNKFGSIEICELDGADESVAFPMPKGLWESDLAAARQKSSAEK